MATLAPDCWVRGRVNDPAQVQPDTFGYDQGNLNRVSLDQADIMNFHASVGIVTVVFAQHWSPGHYLEIAGVPVTQWQAGDWFSWQVSDSVTLANVGITPLNVIVITQD